MSGIVLPGETEGAVCFDCKKSVPEHPLCVGKDRWQKHSWTCKHTSWTCPECAKKEHHMQCPECGCGSEYT